MMCSKVDDEDLRQRRTRLASGNEANSGDGNNNNNKLKKIFIIKTSICKVP